MVKSPSFLLGFTRGSPLGEKPWKRPAATARSGSIVGSAITTLGSSRLDRLARFSWWISFMALAGLAGAVPNKWVDKIIRIDEWIPSAKKSPVALSQQLDYHSYYSQVSTGDPETISQRGWPPHWKQSSPRVPSGAWRRGFFLSSASWWFSWSFWAGILGYLVLCVANTVWT